MSKKEKRGHNGTVTVNRKARYNYEILEKIEAGLCLTGSEVKSLRFQSASLSESYAGEKRGQIFLFNCYIPEYTNAHTRNHAPRRPRKLLLHKREINRLIGLIKMERITLAPLSIYFNEKGVAKIEIGVAKGKKKYDKRETEKQRDWDRQKARTLKDYG